MLLLLLLLDICTFDYVVSIFNKYSIGLIQVFFVPQEKNVAFDDNVLNFTILTFEIAILANNLDNILYSDGLTILVFDHSSLVFFYYSNNLNLSNLLMSTELVHYLNLLPLGFGDISMDSTF